MTQIDFLPEKYRQRDTRRNIRWSRGVVVLIFVGLLAGGSFVLRNKRLAVEAERDLSSQSYDAVMHENKKLSAVLGELNTVRARANLIAYLRQPWSRAQIMTEVLAPLPKGLTLQEVHLQRATDAASGVARTTFAAPGSSPAEPKDAAESDLSRLRREMDARPTVVMITGSMDEATALHRYVAALARGDLFSAVDLLGIDRPESGGGASFRVRATLNASMGDMRPPHDDVETSK